jgi:hypothetical protein
MSNAEEGSILAPLSPDEANQPDNDRNAECQG